MPLTINERITKIEVSGIRQFSNQLIHYPDAVNLTIGQPDFPTPERVKQAGITAITNNLTGYSHNAGLIELRKAVSHFFTEKYSFTYKADSEIIITIGASEAIDAVFRTILEEGDEVILPAPCYPGYAPIITMCGAKVKYLDTSDTGFEPDPERLKGLITEKTKAVLFNFPSNPTGVTIDSKKMDALANVLKEQEIYILSDEIYSENTFIGEHRSFASYPQLRDRLFIIHGLSKSHSMTGWRIGFLLGPEALMLHCIKIHQYNSVCAPLPSQYAAIEALGKSSSVPAEMNKEYMVRRDYIYTRLLAMGLDVVKPNGAFYIFPSIKEFGLPSFEFATRLLKEGGVACVPGSAFSQYGEGFIRISYAYAMPVLVKGMDRMEAYIATLRKEEVGKIV
ncbi:aminotransferase class I/II-fold pyridoxal phosphate-dependent enzyme [Paenisporosarcina sp. TG-14]|uniref:aminotransferase class I/II-fold pyridoxal phosphate-dependent enzyme n=1 Tax=Paenisporosarcina sp. TG-14 TaxID=1231057 RepID=UPI0002E167C0|nr:aminotransferase class I/II-fold pyridoxal phosphate-dependent enzyme [Paenisporosarcina sp. TG-14]